MSRIIECDCCHRKTHEYDMKGWLQSNTCKEIEFMIFSPKVANFTLRKIDFCGKHFCSNLCLIRYVEQMVII